MFTTQHTIRTKATKDAIWKLWTDVSNWNTWDHEVKSSSLNGNFAVGTTGALKPKGGPATTFMITESTMYKSFSDRSFLPFAVMDFIHTMKKVDSEVEITHKVQITGMLSWIFTQIIGKKIAKELPQAMKNLQLLAEKK